MSRLSPPSSFLAASAVHGPLVASDGLLSVIRSGGSSDDWAQSICLESTGFPLLDAAIEAWTNRKVIPGDIFKLLPDIAKGQAWSLAHQWNTSFVEEMLTSLTKVLIEGNTVQDWLETADEIITKYGAASNATRLFEGPGTPTPWYADMVFRTNDASFRAAGRYAEMFAREWIAAAPFWLYSAIHDARTRPEHAALDGRVFRKDDASARYLLPPSAYNCFPAETLVSGRFSGAFKAWYTGPMVEVTTRGGNRLTVTANHPVLTTGGFVRANDLNEGDRLICGAGGIEDGFDADRAHESVAGVLPTEQRFFPSNNDYVENRPAKAGELFETLALVGRSFCAPGTAHDLYGDAAFGDGQIQVVLLHRELTLRADTLPRQRLKDFGLALVDEAKSFISGARAAVIQLGRIFTPFASHPCGGALSLYGSAVQLEAAPLQSLSRALVTERDTSVPKRTGQNTSPESSGVAERLHRLAVAISGSEGRDVQAGSIGGGTIPRHGRTAPPLNAVPRKNLANSRATSPVLDLQRKGAETSEVVADDVVLIKRSWFSGHVYDLQSPYGWILANGIVISNCRCQAIELTDRDIRQGGYSVASSSDIPADQYPEKDWSADRVESLVPEVLRGSLRPPEGVN